MQTKYSLGEKLVTFEEFRQRYTYLEQQRDIKSSDCVRIFIFNCVDKQSLSPQIVCGYHRLLTLHLPRYSFYIQQSKYSFWSLARHPQIKYLSLKESHESWLPDRILSVSNRRMCVSLEITSVSDRIHSHCRCFHCREVS